MEKHGRVMNNSELIEDELWDHYSGLPNPMWYQHIKELNDKEESTNDINDIGNTIQ
jgi:hypothetical protein